MWCGSTARRKAEHCSPTTRGEARAQRIYPQLWFSSWQTYDWLWLSGTLNYLQRRAAVCSTVGPHTARIAVDTSGRWQRMGFLLSRSIAASFRRQWVVGRLHLQTSADPWNMVCFFFFFARWNSSSWKPLPLWVIFFFVSHHEGSQVV